MPTAGSNLISLRDTFSQKSQRIFQFVTLQCQSWPVLIINNGQCRSFEPNLFTSKGFYFFTSRAHNNKRFRQFKTAHRWCEKLKNTHRRIEKMAPTHPCTNRVRRYTKLIEIRWTNRCSSYALCFVIETCRSCQTLCPSSCVPFGALLQLFS